MITTNSNRDHFAGRKTYHRGRWFVRADRYWRFSAPAYVSRSGGRPARSPRVGMRGAMVSH